MHIHVNRMEKTNNSKNSVVDYDYIESILRKELENLGQIEPLQENLEECDLTDEEDENVDSAQAKETYFNDWDVSQYLDIVQNSTRNAQDLLSESMEILGTQDKEMHDLVYKKLKATLAEEESLKDKDLLEIRNKLLAEIEELDVKEETELQNLTLENSNALALLPLEQVISEDIDALEQKAKEELVNLRSRQEEEFKKEKQAQDEERNRKVMEEEEYAEKHRQERESFKRRKSELEEQTKARNVQLGRILEKKDEEIKRLDETFQMSLESLEAEKRKEEETLHRLLNEERERKSQRRNMAAICIQKNFKGFRVRKEFGSKLEALKVERQRKEKERLDQIERVEARIKEENERRKREELERKQREKEERARKIEEERTKLEEERQRLKEEGERRKKEEEKRREEEERKKLEEVERKRKEEERRREEAERKRQEEERRKEEGKKKQREMERMKEEEMKKLEEVEKKRKEEERKREEEEKKQREVEERMKLELKRQKKEEVKRKEEEDKRKREELEQRKKQAEEDKKRKEKEEERNKEEKRKREVEERKKREEEEQNQSEDLSEDRGQSRRREKEAETKRRNVQVTENTTKERTEVASMVETGQSKVQGEDEASQQGIFHASGADGWRVVDCTSSPVSRNFLVKEIKMSGADEVVTSSRQGPEPISPTLPSSMKPNGLSSAEKSLYAEKEVYLKQLQSTWKEKHRFICTRAKISMTKASANRKKRKSVPLATDQELTEEMLLAMSSPETKLHEVVHILLKHLGGISLAKLALTPKVRLVQIENSTVKVIEGLKDCQDLIELQLEKAGVECVSEINGNSLQVLKLNGNSLSSFHGLENCRILEVLDMSNNRLTRLNGLPLSDAMQVLELGSNQLISAKGVGFYGNLTYLNLSNNHLTALTELEYMPLLCSLDASGNGIQEVPNLENNALLQEVYLDNNRISDLTLLSSHWLPLLQTLTLSGNSLSELPSLRNLISLSNLDLSDNLIQNPDHLGDSLSQCRSLGELRLRGNPCTADSSIRQQILRTIFWLHNLDGEALSRKVFKDAPCHLETQSNQQVEDWKKLYQRQKQEISSLQMENTKEDKAGLTLMLLQSRHRTECLALAKRHLQEQLGDKVNETENSILIKSIETSRKAVCITKQIRESRKDLERTEEEAPVKSSAYARPRNLDSEEEKAAIKLQANIRGFLVRRKMQFVFDQTDRNGNSEDSDEFNYDEEVDLASFDFDDADLEWRAPSTPQLPQRYSVLPPTTSTRSNEMPEHREPRPAWPSPQIPNEDVLSYDTTLPLNEISPEDTKSIAVSRVSSKRADELSSEWGFRSNATAELMLKRARRMQKSSSRQQSDADKRLAYFRKMKTVQNPDVHKSAAQKKPQNRTEYFSAKAQVDSPASNASDRDLEAKQLRIFKWVHDQAVLYKDEHGELIAKHEKNKPRAPSDATSPEVISLPVLNPDIIAGKRVPLVSCPIYPEVVRPARTREANYVRAAMERTGAPVMEKAHSAPNPTERTPPVAPGSRDTSTRSGSADIRWRRFSYKR